MISNDPATVPAEADELRDVLIKLRMVLDETIRPPDALTTTELTPLLQAAWPEILKAFNEVDVALTNVSLIGELERVGLRGPSWRVKFAGFTRAFSRLWQAGKAELRKATRSLLRWSNTILGSLTSVVPAAEIIKEFKECVENDLADQADMTRAD